jgi:hypothetical protein
MKLKRNVRTAFVSGHTSITACNTFFAAQVFSDFYPDSKWKPVIWSAAATIPAITGYLRVTAGKHFPTDVMAGYAMGTVIGILVPRLHRNKILKDKGISLNPGMYRVHLVSRFGRYFFYKTCIKPLPCRRRQLNHQTLHFTCQLQLTTQTRIVFHKKCLVEHVFFRFAWFRQIIFTLHVAVTSRAKCHTAASTLDGKFVGFAQFHEVHGHIGRRIQLVSFVFSVNDCYFYHYILSNEL